MRHCFWCWWTNQIALSCVCWVTRCWSLWVCLQPSSVCSFCFQVQFQWVHCICFLETEFVLAFFVWHQIDIAWYCDPGFVICACSFPVFYRLWGLSYSKTLNTGLSHVFSLDRRFFVLWQYNACCAVHLSMLQLLQSPPCMIWSFISVNPFSAGVCRCWTPMKRIPACESLRTCWLFETVFMVIC